MNQQHSSASTNPVKRLKTYRVSSALHTALILMLAVIGVLILVAGHQYQLLEKRIETISSEIIPLITASNNLTKISKDLSAKTNALPLSSNTNQLRSRAAFLNLTSERLRETLEDVSQRYANKSQFRSLLEVHRQLQKNNSQLANTIHQRMELSASQEEMPNTVDVAETSITQKIFEDMTGLQSSGISPQKKVLLDQHYAKLMMTFHRMIEILNSIGYSESMNDLTQLESRYASLTRKVATLTNQANQLSSQRKFTEALSSFAQHRQEVHDLIELHKRIIETLSEEKWLIQVNNRLASQFSAITAAIVADSNHQAESSRQSFELQLASAKTIIFQISIFGLVIAISTAWYLGRARITKPLMNLLSATRAIERGDPAASASERGVGEIGLLARSFNQMAKKVQQRERELDELHRLLEQVQNSISSALITVDKDAKTLLWNNPAAKICDLDDDNLQGISVDTAWAFLKPSKGSIQEVIATQKATYYTRIRWQIDGIWCELDIMVFPLQTEDFRGAVIRIDDVTERLQMEEAIVQNEKMLSVGGLAAGMAHEINNPLAGMMQTANVIQHRLADKDMPANQRAANDAGTNMDAIHTFMQNRNVLSMIASIRETGQRAAEIVDNMLSFARKGSSAIALYDVTELLDKAVDLATTDYDLKEQYDFKAIKITREYEPNLPSIPCEGAKIQQVLLNILRNGAQAMQEAGGKEPNFTLRAINNAKQNRIRIEIEDNGPGIEEAIRKRIFEPFFTTKSIGIGTGLGLSVSYFIITENHNGEMLVESTPGMGACFIISLPVKQPEI